ncbi:transposase [Streptomyces werraensis]|uniref:transposase n=1 Tax=Streptomyces werraensis TaxID=68284 RepID=UPI00382AA2F7
MRLRTLADVFAYAEAEGADLRVGGTEVQVRRPRAGRAGRKAFVSGKKKQNTAKTTTISDGSGRLLWSGADRPGRMHDQTAVHTEGIAEQFRLHPRVQAKMDEGYRGLANEFPGQVSAPPKKPPGRRPARRTVCLARAAPTPVLQPDLRGARHRRGELVRQFRSDQSVVGPGVPLTDAQWARIEPLLPDRTPKRGGRWRDHREVIDAIAHKFQTGTQWVPSSRRRGKHAARHCSIDAASVRTSTFSRNGAPLATKVQGFHLSAIRSASALTSTVTPCSASASMIVTMSTGALPSRSATRAPPDERGLLPHQQTAVRPDSRRA